jgi:hypothetical protein
VHAEDKSPMTASESFCQKIILPKSVKNYSTLSAFNGFSARFQDNVNPRTSQLKISVRREIILARSIGIQ